VVLVEAWTRRVEYGAGGCDLNYPQPGDPGAGRTYVSGWYLREWTAGLATTTWAMLDTDDFDLRNGSGADSFDVRIVIKPTLSGYNFLYLDTASYREGL